MNTEKITIKTVVKADLATVWYAWNSPDDIIQWNAASADWHTTTSEVDLRIGGKFSSRMEAKDGSMGFDFGGTYTEVVDQQRVASELGDGRTVLVIFEVVDDGVLVTETFDAETQNPVDMQRAGWQSILDNFAQHVESQQG